MHFFEKLEIDTKRVLETYVITCHWRRGFDCVGARSRFKHDRKNYAFSVGKQIGPISIKSTFGAQGTDTRRKTDPRLVYLDEGRDPGEGEGGGEPPTPSRERGIETRQDP